VLSVHIDVDETEREVLADLLKQSMGDLRAKLYTSLLSDGEDPELEQREQQLGRLLTLVTSATPRAEIL
jgi:hypothetical protein